MKITRSGAAALVSLLACGLFHAGFASGQAAPPPPPPSLPISDLDQMTRLHEAGKAFPDALATLELTYSGSGDLRSRMVKNGLYSIFPTIKVNGKQIKRISNGKKVKVQEAVEAGPINVSAQWAKTGVRPKTKCAGELGYGFHQVIFIPFGAPDNFGCIVEPRILPDEVLEAWESGLEEAQAAAFGECSSVHAAGSSELWACLVEADVPLPVG